MIDKNYIPCVMSVKSDNGEHSHFRLFDSKTGATIWEEKEDNDVIEKELLSMSRDEKLNFIFNYFGGRENKLHKLFEEAGEYRDRLVLNNFNITLEDRLVIEICDMKSCIDQLYNNEPKIRDFYDLVINKTIIKIKNNVYSKE